MSTWFEESDLIESSVTDTTALVTGGQKEAGRELVLPRAGHGASAAVQYCTRVVETTDVESNHRDRGAALTTVPITLPTRLDVDAIFDHVEFPIGPVAIQVNNVGTFASDHWESKFFET